MISKPLGRLNPFTCVKQPTPAFFAPNVTSATRKRLWATAQHRRQQQERTAAKQKFAKKKSEQVYATAGDVHDIRVEAKPHTRAKYVQLLMG